MGRTPTSSKDAGLTRGAWTVGEDQILINYVKNHGQGKWSKISKKTGLKRCGKSCRLRWLNYLRPDIKRGNITEDEEDIIIRLHKLLGNRWSLIAGRIPGRTDNEIKNYWNTTLKKKMDSPKSTQEDKIISSVEKSDEPCFSDIKPGKKDEATDSENWLLSALENNCWDLETAGGGNEHQIGSLDFPMKEDEQGGMMLFSSSNDAELSYEDLKGMNWSDEDINLVLQFALDA